LDYYTGTVYETNLVDYPELGSVCSGGRYDDLASNYTKNRLPGVGISIGLSRLFYGLTELGVVKPASSTLAEVAVLAVTPAEAGYASGVASDLRRVGINVALYADEAPLAKKMKFVDRSGIAYAAIIGESEARDGTASLKTMETGETLILTAEEIAGVIGGWVGARGL
jgi:histidyl-tRNA synthetase